jgi:hypothetical protein
MHRYLATFAVLFWLVEPALADVDSGPATGEKVPALKVHAVVGNAEGKEIDYAAERKDSPTVYLLVDRARFSRPIARFMKELDGKVSDAAKGAYVVAVWLSDDLDKTKEYLPVAQKSLSFQNTALTAFANQAGPEGWGVNSTADLTVVVANQGKVVARFGFVSVNETLVARVVEELKKSAAEK